VPRGPGRLRRVPSRRPTPTYWLRVGPALVVCAAVVHLPSFIRSVWNPDEGFLATQARMLAAGGSLYNTVVDRKPPLLPWLYEGAFALFGDGSLWPVRVLAVLAHVVTAALLVSLARRRWGDRWGAAAGLGYLLLSIGLAPEDTQAANFEIFTLPWTVAAVTTCASTASTRTGHSEPSPKSAKAPS
jgi:4-amino-4-deoxy-L-arabinose transferase-like glycosyltransferase